MRLCILLLSVLMVMGSLLLWNGHLRPLPTADKGFSCSPRACVNCLVQRAIGMPPKKTKCSLPTHCGILFSQGNVHTSEGKNSVDPSTRNKMENITLCAVSTRVLKHSFDEWTPNETKNATIQQMNCTTHGLHELGCHPASWMTMEGVGYLFGLGLQKVPLTWFKGTLKKKGSEIVGGYGSKCLDQVQSNFPEDDVNAFVGIFSRSDEYAVSPYGSCVVSYQRINTRNAILSSDSCVLNHTIGPLGRCRAVPERNFAGIFSVCQIRRKSKKGEEKMSSKCSLRYDFQRTCSLHNVESALEKELSRKIRTGKARRNSLLPSTPYAQRWHFGRLSTYISDELDELRGRLSILVEILKRGIYSKGGYHRSLSEHPLLATCTGNSFPETAFEHMCTLSTMLIGLVLWQYYLPELRLSLTKHWVRTVSIASAYVQSQKSVIKTFPTLFCVTVGCGPKNFTVKLQSWVWSIGICASMCLCFQTMACVDTSGISELSNWNCLEYNSSGSMLELTCSFKLKNCNDCITLQNDEVFEGHGHEISITSCFEWDGLFEIAESATSLDNAPVIQNVHMIGGETSTEGGFIVRKEQKHFVVDSCSSTGVIKGDGSGGICGRHCSGDIQIKNCSSSGAIAGEDAGGIAGREVGTNGDGIVNITQCHSTGDIMGPLSGGICGWGAGRSNGHVRITYSYSTGKIGNENCGGLCGSYAGRGGHVSITHSYSTGEIAGDGCGGLCGHSAGYWNGEVTIEQCYSLGEISGPAGGGITGRLSASQDGNVYITNCYSRGNIAGSDHAGGICGAETGAPHPAHDDGGTVILANVYASGNIMPQDAGGLVGEIANEAKQIRIIMSVYDGNSGDMIGDENDVNVTKENNSGNLTGIIGAVYCYEDQDNNGCWDNETIWKVVENDFPVLQSMPSLAPSATPSPTPSTSPTSSNTGTSTNTVTPSSTGTLSPTETGMCTPSATPTSKRKREQKDLPVQYPRRSVI